MKRRLIISEKNLERIQTRLDEAQAKSRVRNITAREMLDAVNEITEKLGIAKTDMEGIIAFVDLNARNFPNAYRGQPESTHFNAIFQNGSWRYLAAQRDYTHRESKRVQLHFPAQAKEAILAKAARLQ